MCRCSTGGCCIYSCVAAPEAEAWAVAPHALLTACRTVRFHVAQIVLLGVVTSAGPAGKGDPLQELTLHTLPDYSVPTDNVIMTCATGTAAGRIFMGGADGRLYEVTYGSGRGGRCRKVRRSGRTPTTPCRASGVD